MRLEAIQCDGVLMGSGSGNFFGLQTCPNRGNESEFCLFPWMEIAIEIVKAFWVMVLCCLIEDVGRELKMELSAACRYKKSGLCKLPPGHLHYSVH